MKHILNFEQFNESILFPQGGTLKGHEKQIKDKDFDDKVKKTRRYSSDAWDVAHDKWLERFEDYFGTRDQKLVEDFLDFYGKYNIPEYNKDRTGYKEWRKIKPNTVGDKIDNIINLIKYDTKYSVILKHFGIEPTEEGVDKLADLFPKMEYTREHMNKNANKSRGEMFESKK